MFEICVRNNTVQRVWVAVCFRNKHKKSGVYFWATKGWWKVKPGEKAYLVNTMNRHIYFYAYNKDRKWSGNKKVRVHNGVMTGEEMDLGRGEEYYTANFFHVDMGPEYVPYTLNLK